QLDFLQVLPVAQKVFHRVFARAKQISDGGVDDHAEHQAGAFDPGPQLLNVVEAVLFGAGQVAVDAGMRQVRGWFLVEPLFRLLNWRGHHCLLSSAGTRPVRCSSTSRRRSIWSPRGRRHSTGVRPRCLRSSWVSGPGDLQRELVGGAEEPAAAVTDLHVDAEALAPLAVDLADVDHAGKDGL